MRLFIDGEESPDDGRPVDISYSTMRMRDGDMHLTTKGPCVGGPLDGQVRRFESGTIMVHGATPDSRGWYRRVGDRWEWIPRA
jgi:hypothetical protein